MAAKKSKANPDVLTHRQMLRAHDAPQFEEACRKEMDGLFEMGVFEKATIDDPRVKQAITDGEVVDLMLVGARKRDDKHRVIGHKGRCVYRGDQDSFADANERYSPASTAVCRSSGEAIKVLREQDEQEYDYHKAYLQGKPTDGRVRVVRAPVGFRNVDEDGKEYYLILTSALYGQPDAGAVWYRTLKGKMVCDEPAYNYSCCHAEPSLFCKRVGDENDELVCTPVYVDDGKFFNDPTPAARAQAKMTKEQIKRDFKIDFGDLNPQRSFVLNSNMRRYDARHTSLSKESYITNRLVKHLPSPVESYPKVWREMPHDKHIAEDYEKALAQKAKDKTLIDTFGTVVGAIGYAVDGRPDIATGVGILQQCLNFPSEAMLQHAYRHIVFLYYTAKDAIHYTKVDGTDGHKLKVYVDSDWSVKRSRYGFAQILANGTVSAKSRKEHCIALSSTEAELMGLGATAPEVLHTMSIMEACGFEFTYNTPAAICMSAQHKEAHKLLHTKMEYFRHGPVDVHTDSKGAYDLCHREGPGKNSRHIERRVYKMRELRGLNKVAVRLIPTHENPADILTKPVDAKTFHAHRHTLMNLAADTGA
jgi:hypothetical protein